MQEDNVTPGKDSDRQKMKNCRQKTQFNFLTFIKLIAETIRVQKCILDKYLFLGRKKFEKIVRQV